MGRMAGDRRLSASAWRIERALAMVVGFAGLSFTPMSGAALAADIVSSRAAPAQAATNAEDFGSINFVVANDVFNGTDRYYTNGGLLTYTASPLYTPDWAVSAAKTISYFSNWTTVRASYAIGQDIFTPKVLGATNPDPRDRPYAGWLYGSFGLIGETGDTLDQIGLNLGVVGPAALGREVQNGFHSLVGDNGSQGWSYQLRNEPTVNLFYQRSWRELASASFGYFGADITPHAGFALGNAYDYANAGAVLRFGHNLQLDYGPPQINPSLPGTGFFNPTHDLSWYLFAAFDGRAVGRNIFLDGNTFTDSRRVGHRVFVGEASAGAMVTWRNVQLGYVQIWRSAEFAGRDTKDLYSAVTLSARW